MGNGIYIAVRDFCSVLGADGVFLCALILAFINFKVFLLTFLFSKKTGKKWRFFYFLPFFALFFLFYAFFTASGINGSERAFYAFILLFFGTGLFGVFFSFPEKKKKENANDTFNKIKISPEQHRFLSFLEQGVKDSPKKDGIEQDKNPNCGVDFTHVKNIMRRMEKLPVSAQEKKQLNDLSVLMYRAENGDFTLKKSEINDALSSLLKIMSKYGG